MGSKRLKSLLVAILGLFFTVFSLSVKANEEAGEKALDPAKVIMEHIQDAHDFHFFTLKKADGTEFHASIPLPVILYSQTKGLVVFSSSQFHHGHASYQGYQLEENKIHSEDPAEVFYDLSITKNVVQMLIALTLLVVLLIGVPTSTKKVRGLPLRPRSGKMPLSR